MTEAWIFSENKMKRFYPSTFYEGSSSMESVSIEANGQQIGFIHGLVARFLHPLIEDSTYDVKVSFLKEKQTHRCNYIEVQISGKDTANSSFQEATEFSKTKGSLEECNFNLFYQYLIHISFSLTIYAKSQIMSGS